MFSLPGVSRDVDVCTSNERAVESGGDGVVGRRRSMSERRDVGGDGDGDRCVVLMRERVLVGGDGDAP